MSDLSYKITSVYTTLTQTERKAANYITENSNAIAFESLDNLALKIGVSTTSIIRLAKALGYSGYAEMRQSIQENLNGTIAGSMRKRFIASDKISDTDKMLMSYLNKNMEIIKNTFESQRTEDLQDAINTITNAKNVYVIGLSDSFTLAYNMSIRLGQIRKSVHLMQSVGAIFPMELQDAGPEDVCIGFLFPSYSKVTANILAMMKMNGTRVILFTSQNTAPVKEYGDIILPCDISVINIKDSNVGPLCLSDYIVDAIAVGSYDKSMEVLSKTEEIISHGYYLNP